jgi:prepilin peptidase CpaA
MSIPLISEAALAATVGLLLYVCYTDFARLHISNKACIAVVGLFAVYSLTTAMAPIDMAWHYGAGLAIFAAGFVLYAIGLRFGAGDVKLLSALAIWTGFSGLWPLMLVMSIVGGILAILVLGLRQFGVHQWIAAHGWHFPALELEKGKSYVPYAPAMAAAFFYLLYSNGAGA